MSPTPQPIPIEIFSHTESDGNNSSHRHDNKDIGPAIHSNQRFKYRGAQKKFIMSKFSLNQPQDMAQRRRNPKDEGMHRKDANRPRKQINAVHGIKSDSLRSLNDSNANYDSSPQLTEQKSVR